MTPASTTPMDEESLREQLEAELEQSFSYQIVTLNQEIRAAFQTPPKRKESRS